MIYTVGVGVEMYIDNALVSGNTDNAGYPGGQQNGHIVLGRHYVDAHDIDRRYGKATIDSISIWDKPLSAEERNLVHQL